ncbi:F-box/kelch-repeat protein [Raphanus sativus]|uniref:F-box/kelch-repeat protein At5g51250-like n=1 Tax=Raphanus sativus TaxID=3726 RepID=A0A6J0L9R7_RAPSA|nr:F-box/kelch-repeat protein At5g51250-like [Raphanus sativus]KAJ4878695.1 F-box/kelch-repeat protein [Raphanus sativus]
MERSNKGDFVSKRKRKTATTSTRAKKKKPILASLSSLPNDLLVMIVARVPILYYRNLSIVSKSFRSMVASPELYKVRSLLGLTESCLYVCLRFGLGSCKWYTLSSKSSGGGYVLGRVPIANDSPCNVGLGLGNSDLVAVGSDIYNIDKADKTTPTSSVSILDCKSHMWRKAPSIPMEIESLSARVLDRNIFVFGRRYHQDGSWKGSLQVFNTDTQTWDIPRCVLDQASHTFTIDGNLHAVNIFGWVFAFNSKQRRWDLVEIYPSVGEITYSKSYCEIDNVLYSVSKDGALRWYDTDKTRWKDLKGLVGLPKLPNPFAGYGFYVKLTGYGGRKMMVFWSTYFSIPFSPMETIYCAEIALERRNGDCWGKLEWYDGVLSVLAGTKFVKVLSVTL